MFDNKKFQELVAADNLTGEVVATNSFIVEVKGLEGIRLGAQVLFEDGQRGLVREAYGDRVILFNIDSERIDPGTLAVLENDTLSVPVGKQLIGRVISPIGEPLDGKGTISTATVSGIFNPAPGIMDRSVLNEQLASGVTAVDMFFPVVLGQRIAILGDSKSGKSTFLSQLSANQQSTDRVVVYVLVGKRKVDVERLLANLRDSGAMKNTIVVLADIFSSLTQSYLAPYAACAMAEALWQAGQDVIVVYDDLSSHAEAYRQLSLLQEVDPGRDSFPGDMFYAHSSLLERAGKLLTNQKTLTALPVVVTPNDDITAYLSTSIMSITDGQIIFDLGLFREGIRPAVNAGLSVSRVGGQAQTHRQKGLSSTLFQKLAKYHQAEEFSHFGSSLSKDAAIDLKLGKQIYAILQQPPQERHSLVEQQLMLETVLAGAGQVDLDINGLKDAARKVAPQVKEDKDYDHLEQQLLGQFTIKPKVTETPVEAPGAAPPPSQPPDDGKGQKVEVKTDQESDKKPADTPPAEPAAAAPSEDKSAQATPVPEATKTDATATPTDTTSPAPTGEAPAPPQPAPAPEATQLAPVVQAEPEHKHHLEDALEPAEKLIAKMLPKKKRTGKKPGPKPYNPNKVRVKPVAMRKSKPTAKKKKAGVKK